MPRNEAIEFFVRGAIAHARTLPIGEAVKFLRGLLEMAGDQPEVAEVRQVFVKLSDSDHQLELISRPQLNLPLDGAATKS